MSEEDRPNFGRWLSWALMFAALAYWAYQESANRAPHALIGRVAPTFAAEIVAGPGTGDRVSSASVEGNVVLLDFWASWCGPCRLSMPIVSRIAMRNPSLLALGVNLERERGPEFVRRAHAQLGARFPSLLDLDGSMQSNFEVSQIPTLILLDRHRVVRWAGSGVPDEHELEAEVRRLSASE